MEDLMKLVTVQEMVELERAADAKGHSYDTMMERAGRAVAEAIQQCRDVEGEKVLILVGPGNNGSDGLVAARYLAQAGARVVCYLIKARSDDDLNVQRLQEHDVDWLHPEEDTNDVGLREALEGASVVIDALLGTGVDRPLEGKVKEILNLAREVVQDRCAPRPTGPWLTGWMELTPRLGCAAGACDCQDADPLVVAVDVPSGLNCDTGAVDPATLPADLTVTFAVAKRGQFRFPGARVLGELVVADIGIDPTLGADIRIEVATAPTVTCLLPARPLDAHKGTFGKAMVVAGSVNYTGAAYLAAAAAGRVGTGLVTLAPPAQIHPILATKLTEATFLLLPHSMGVLAPDATKVLAPYLEGYAAMLLGPGLGREQETVQFVHRLLGIETDSQPTRIGFQAYRESSPPMVTLPPLVIDADALNALSEADRWWTALPSNTILTPHPGEMGRLMGADVATVNSDRLTVARDKAAEWNHVIVLKGAFTVVAAPDGRTTVIPFANPILATAGTGDVLAGAIVGLLAQGLEPFDAAVCGAYLHGLAGELLSEWTGDAGALAGDLLHMLPQAMSRLKHPG
jgi:hydroxyethylthiazole kinase-like uncharacterized protein yjeF